MFFPEEETEKVKEEKVIFIYETGNSSQKPIELKATHKRIGLADVRKALGLSVVRLFNSDGAQYFDDDLKYLKHGAVLYATRGEEFDTSACFKQYEMGQKLGEGGFGNVFLAHHVQTGQRYAIKIIKTENIGSASDIDSIFVEAEILKSLNHENIVKVHNCLTLKNMEVAIIMQFLEGGQLLKVVEKEGKLSEQAAQTFLKQIVKGMRYCHQNNLIHRDLKLENVLLVNSQEKKIKIIDFGIAGAISLMKSEDLDTGSLAYMAPQCFINDKNYKIDGRIDVWATGVILYTMLHGHLPFKGNNNHDIIEAIKAGKFKIDPALEKTLTEACIDVLKQCLEVNAKSRITMQQLADHPWLSRKIEALRREEPVKMEVIKQQPVKKEKAKAKTVVSKPGHSPVVSSFGNSKPGAGKFGKK